MNLNFIATSDLGDHFDTSQLPGGGALQIDMDRLVAALLAHPAALSALVAGIAARAQNADIAALLQAGMKTLPVMAAGDAAPPVAAGAFFINSSKFVVQAQEN